jgi:hypothetical protein
MREERFTLREAMICPSRRALMLWRSSWAWGPLSTLLLLLLLPPSACPLLSGTEEKEEEKEEATESLDFRDNLELSSPGTTFLSKKLNP